MEEVLGAISPGLMYPPPLCWSKGDNEKQAAGVRMTSVLFCNNWFGIVAICWRLSQFRCLCQLNYIASQFWGELERNIILKHSIILTYKDHLKQFAVQNDRNINVNVLWSEMIEIRTVLLDVNFLQFPSSPRSQTGKLRPTFFGQKLVKVATFAFLLICPSWWSIYHYHRVVSHISQFPLQLISRF